MKSIKGTPDLTDNAVGKLPNAAKLPDNWRALVAAIIYGHVVVGTVVVTRSNIPNRAHHNVLAAVMMLSVICMRFHLLVRRREAHRCPSTEKYSFWRYSLMNGWRVWRR